MIQQGYGSSAGLPAGEYTRVVLDALAGADLAEHFHVVPGALLDTLGFNKFIVFGEVFHALLHFLGDIVERVVQPRLSNDVVRRREYHNVQQRSADVAGERVEFANAVYLVPEEFHADSRFVGAACREYLQGISLGAELVSGKRHFVALVLYLDKAFYDLLAAYFLTLAERQRVAAVILRAAEGVNAGNGSHDDNVPAFCERHGGGVAQTVDLVVDGAVLFNVGVGGGNVRLRLVIVVVGHEIFHRIIREELPELGAQLRRKGLVVCEDEGRPVAVGDDVRHGECLAGAGDAEQRLFLVAPEYPLGEGVNRLGLVAGGGIL